MKQGSGKLTLTGNNTYTGGTTLTSGTLSISSDTNIGGANTPITFGGGRLQVTGTTLQNLNNHSVNWSSFNGGLDIADAGNTFTLSQGLGGTGLNKYGSGTLVLSGSGNTYAIGIGVNSGMLRVDGGTVSGSLYTWNNTTIEVNGGTITGPTNSSGGTARINGGTVSGQVTGYGMTIQINGGNVSGLVGGYQSTVQINGGNVSGNLQNISGTVVFANSADMAYNGTITSGSLVKQGAGKLTLGGSSSSVSSVTLTSGTLSISSDSNIGGASTPITFGGGRLQVTGTTLQNLSGHSVNWSSFNGGLDITDAGNTFTLSQSIGGTGTLSKYGNGTLVLSGSASSYATAVQVNAGKLRVDSGSVSGSITAYAGATLEIDGGIVSSNVTVCSATAQINGGTVSGSTWANLGGTVRVSGGDVSGYLLNIFGGAVIFVNTADMTYGGTIGGNGTVTIQGGGKVTLPGNHAGTTSVLAGTLALNGSLTATSAVTVASGALLTGTGNANGSVTLASGGSIQPTGGLGILRTGNLSLPAGSTMSVALDGNTLATQYGQVSVTGQVNLSGSTLTLAGTRSNDDGHDLIVLANDGTDPIVGTFAGLAEGATLAVADVNYTISYAGGDGNDVVLTDKPMAVAINGSSIADEGTTLTFSSTLSNTPDVVAYAWSVTKNGSTFTLPANTVTNASTFSFVPTDNGEYAVTLLVQDTYSHTASAVHNIAVSNLAPTFDLAVLPMFPPTREGQTATMYPPHFDDPSSIDRATLRFSVATSIAGLASSYAQAMNNWQFVIQDDVYTLYARVFDKDGGWSQSSCTITLANVAPTATFAVPSTTVNEGGSITATFSGPADPSAIDTSAGFHYSYATSESVLATTYANAIDGASKVVPFPDNGTYTLYGRVFDKDNGYTQYSRTYSVANVAPTVSILANPVNVYQEGSLLHFAASVTDPGVNDSFTYAWTVTKQDDPSYTLPAGTIVSTADFSFTPPSPGTYSLVLAVTDNDLAQTVVSQDMPITVAAPTDISVSSVSSTEVIVSWTNNSALATGCDVQQWINGAWATVGTTTTPTQTSLPVTGLSPASNYYFQVIAIGATPPDNSLPYDLGTITTASSQPAVDIYTDDNWAIAGTPLTFFADVTDEGNGGPVQLSWTVFRGTSQIGSPETGDEFVFQPTASGQYTITLTATDNLGSTGTQTYSIGVASADLILTGPEQVDEGDQFTLTLPATTVATLGGASWLIHWGDGSSAGIAAASAATVPHPYDDGPSFWTIDASLLDADGNIIGTGSLDVEVFNVAPDASINGDNRVVDGNSYALELSTTDPGEDDVTWSIDWGDGSDPDADGNVGQTVAAQFVDGTEQQITHNYPATMTHAVISAIAVDKDGGSTVADPIRIEIAPAAPTYLTATTVSSSEVELEWGAASGGISGYRIERSSDGEHFSPFAEVSADTTAFLASGLTCGTSYTFRVESLHVQASGDTGCSDSSEIASATTSVSTPTGVSATTLAPDPWSISWTPLEDPVDSYEVWYACAGSGWEYFDYTNGDWGPSLTIDTSRLAPGSTYQFCVCARVGEELSEKSPVILLTMPDVSAPPSIDWGEVGADGASINWIPDNHHAQNYQIQYSDDEGQTFLYPLDGFGHPLASFSGDVTRATFYLPYEPERESIECRIREKNAAGWSNWSDPVTLIALPYRSGPVLWTDNPTWLAAQQTMGLNHGWMYSEASGQTFAFYNYTSSDDFYLTRSGPAGEVRLPFIGDDHIPPNAEFLYTLYSYGQELCSFRYHAGFFPVEGLTANPLSSGQMIHLSWDPVAGAVSYGIMVNFDYSIVVDGSQTWCDIPSLPTTSSTVFRVGAMSADGYGSQGHLDISSIVATAEEATEDPTPTAQFSDQNMLHITWPDPQADVTGFDLYVDGTWDGERSTKEMIDLPAGQRYCDLPGATSDSTYSATLRVWYAAGFVRDYRTDTTDLNFIAPEDLTATPVGSGTVRLCWSEVADDESTGPKEGYRIEKSTDCLRWQAIGETGDITFDATGLQQDTVYQFRVKAYSSIVDGDWSEAARARTTPQVSGAVRALPELFSQQLPLSEWDTEDGSTDSAVLLGFTASFLGMPFSSMFVNENGTISFDGANDAYDPDNIRLPDTPVIAGLLSDVSRVCSRSGNVSYGWSTIDGHSAFAATWWDVSYYYAPSNGQPLVSPTNQYQIVLIDRSDVVPGDFDIELNYGHVRWEQACYEDEDNQGLGDDSTPALAGWSNGAGSYFEFDGSCEVGRLLDDSSTGLAVTSTNSDVTGRHVFEIRNKPGLYIDSSNTKGFGLPDVSGALDAIKDDPSKPGKIVLVDNADGDADGIPDFADGFSADSTTADVPVSPNDDESAGLQFVPVVFRGDGDPAALTFQIAYDASDPAGVLTTGTGAPGDPFIYHLPTTIGRLRLWTRDGSAKRSGANFDSLDFSTLTDDQKALGYYVAPGSYGVGSWAKLAQACGLPADSLQLTLYVEAVKLSTALGDSEITFNVDPDGDGPRASRGDAVRLTAGQFNVDIDSDNNNATGNPDRTDAERRLASLPDEPGKVIIVNNDDTDHDGIPGWADGFDRFDTVGGSAFAADNQTGNDHFVPLLIQLPLSVDPADARLVFSYSASAPGKVQRNDKGQYSINGTGVLRLWSKDGSQQRNSQTVLLGGDYVTQGAYVHADQLQYDPATRTITVWVEAVRPTQQAADQTVKVELYSYANGKLSSKMTDRTVRVTATYTDLAADNNRDGRIEFDGQDQTASSTPFLFWLNNNRDVWGGSDYQAAVSVNSGELDCNSPLIGSILDAHGNTVTDPATLKEVAARDLEDFAQLGLRWSDSIDAYVTSFRIRLESSSSPDMKVRLFLSTPQLQDGPLSATSQVDDQQTITNILSFNDWAGRDRCPGSFPDIRLSGVELSDGASYTWTPDGVNWNIGASDAISAEHLLSLIFEGVGAGTGQIVFELMHGDQVLTSSAVDLKLRPIDQLYDTYTVAYGPNVDSNGLLMDDINLGTNPVPTTADLLNTNQERDRFLGQSSNYFVFVHGWRMQKWERTAFAESTYKRMFWSNYTGQFGFFDWPTQQIDAVTKDAGNFDRSEFVAWNSAAGLVYALQDIRSYMIPLDGKVSVMAHSMGNVVLSEALHQAEGAATPLVDTAIMSQAAISSSYFTPHTDLLPSIYVPGHGTVWTDHVIEHTNPSWTEYRGFDPIGGAHPGDSSYPPDRLPVIGGLTPRFSNISSSAGKLLNYYNPDDYALASWKLDQALKPTTDRWLATVLIAESQLDFGNVSLVPDSLSQMLVDLGQSLFMGRPIPGFSNTTYTFDSSNNTFYRISWIYDNAIDDITHTPVGWVQLSRTPLSLTTDLYEMFAFCASSVVAPLGTVDWRNVSGVFSGGQNLKDLVGTTAFSALNTGHSAQFVGSYLSVAAYWKKVVGDIQ